MGVTERGCVIPLGWPDIWCVMPMNFVGWQRCSEFSTHFNDLACLCAMTYESAAKTHIKWARMNWTRMKYDRPQDDLWVVIDSLMSGYKVVRYSPSMTDCPMSCLFGVRLYDLPSPDGRWTLVVIGGWDWVVLSWCTLVLKYYFTHHEHWTCVWMVSIAYDHLQ